MVILDQIIHTFDTNCRNWNNVLLMCCDDASGFECSAMIPVEERKSPHVTYGRVVWVPLFCSELNCHSIEFPEALELGHIYLIIIRFTWKNKITLPRRMSSYREKINVSKKIERQIVGEENPPSSRSMHRSPYNRKKYSDLK